MRRTREILVRLWRLVEVLQGRRLGATVAVLLEELQTSRATLYRDLRLLDDAGVRIAVEHVNGEARYSLVQHALPQLAPSPRQLLALRLARSMLAPLEGTALCDELDALVRSAAPPRVEGASVTSRPSSRPGPWAGVTRSAELAIERRRRMQLRYRAGSTGQTRWRTIDPLSLHLVGDHAYLVAYDLEKRAPRAFKVARILEARAIDEASERHPEIDVGELFRHAVRIWAGAPVEVSVWLAPDVGWRAAEWPLHGNQVVESQPDGAVVVRARVAGVIETTRWVLGWGAAARALSPPELCERIEAELRGALNRYPATASGRQLLASELPTPQQVVSSIVRHAGVRVGSRRAANDGKARSTKPRP